MLKIQIRIKALSLFLILNFIPKFALAQFIRSESEEEKFRTVGFVMQIFPDNARKLRHGQIPDKCV